MSDGVNDFIKNAGLFTLTHFLVTAISMLMGFALFLLAQSRRQMAFFLVVGILPAGSGILTAYFKNKYSGVGMFGPPGPDAIAAAHREALIDLGVGLAAAGVILLLRYRRQRINAKRDG